MNYAILVDYFSDFCEVAKLNDTTSSSVIEFRKQQSSWHGISNVLLLNFLTLGNLIMSRHPLYHSQSNGDAESAVKIAKGIFKKSQRDKKDLQLSILDWRNTPTESMSLSTVQRLFSRRIKTILPTTSVLLAPSVSKESDETKTLTGKRNKAKFIMTEMHILGAIYVVMNLFVCNH